MNLLILLTLVGGSIGVFDSLPDRIPGHAGLTGNFDAYRASTWVNWLLVPSIAVLLSAMMDGFAWLIGQSLDGINTPNHKTDNALSITHRRQIAAIVTMAVVVGKRMALKAETLARESSQVPVGIHENRP